MFVNLITACLYAACVVVIHQTDSLFTEYHTTRCSHSDFNENISFILYASGKYHIFFSFFFFCIFLISAQLKRKKKRVSNYFINKQYFDLHQSNFPYKNNIISIYSNQRKTYRTFKKK